VNEKHKIKNIMEDNSMKRCHVLLVLIIALSTPLALLAEEESIAELDGFIDPYMIVNVGSGVAAVIDTITVDRGDFVKKGQVIATLDSRVEKATMELTRARAELNAGIELQKARVDFSTRELEREDGLYKKNAIPFHKRDETRTELEIAKCQLCEAVDKKEITKLELKQALAVLEKRTIRSTVEGVVVERFLSPGERVDDQPILKLAQLNPLNVEVIAPVSLWGSIEEGMRAEVRPESPVEGVYTGHVKIVDNVIDASSGTFGIRVELSNPNYALPSGLKCQVRFLKD
jgi:RND family efflux transporter MFP subunit